MSRPLAALLTGALLLVPSAAAEAKKRPSRQGGKVTPAWPETKRGKPRSGLAQFLAQQVGGLKPPSNKSKGKARGTARLSAATAVAATDCKEPLRLVRSFDIPKDDPSYARLLNVSFTYDTALAAAAHSAVGDRDQAEQLLSQLQALQRKDGAIEYAWDPYTCTPANSSLRTGAIAWMGMAEVGYQGAFHNDRYQKVSQGVADWLYSLQSENGLVRGGPDVSWQSTQHNLLAWIFLQGYADEKSTNKDEREKAVAAMNRIAGGIDKNLLVDDGTGLHFIQGAGDGVLPLDVQTLGVLYLHARGRDEEAGRVAEWFQKNLAIGGVSIALSKDPATYNMSYQAKGPFVGFRPYADEDAPSILWMEGTLQARMALEVMGIPSGELQKSIDAWKNVTRPDVGPLMANATVTTQRFNEYHVWPVSATASWSLLLDGKPLALTG